LISVGGGGYRVALRVGRHTRGHAEIRQLRLSVLFIVLGQQLGFSIFQGSGFRVRGSGFRVRGSEFRVQGLSGSTYAWPRRNPPASPFRVVQRVRPEVDVHSLLYHSTLGSRVIKQNKKEI
jgi:hypothetical protein